MGWSKYIALPIGLSVVIHIACVLCILRQENPIPSTREVARVAMTIAEVEILNEPHFREKEVLKLAEGHQPWLEKPKRIHPRKRSEAHAFKHAMLPPEKEAQSKIVMRSEPAIAGEIGQKAASQPIGFEDYTVIRQRVANALLFPPKARRLGMQGKVMVGFQILSNGLVKALQVISGSGFEIFDQAALQAVRDAAPFAPRGLAANVEIPISFELTR